MTNLEWLYERGLVTTNFVYNDKDGYPNRVMIGVNLVISIRDDIYEKYKKKGIEWLLEEHKEPIKLKQYEMDTLEIAACKETPLSNYSFFTEMRKRGHFKGITDTSMNLREILDNFEVIDD